MIMGTCVTIKVWEGQSQGLIPRFYVTTQWASNKTYKMEEKI